MASSSIVLGTRDVSPPRSKELISPRTRPGTGNRDWLQRLEERLPGLKHSRSLLGSDDTVLRRSASETHRCVSIDVRKRNRYQDDDTVVQPCYDSMAEGRMLQKLRASLYDSEPRLLHFQKSAKQRLGAIRAQVHLLNERFEKSCQARCGLEKEKVALRLSEIDDRLQLAFAEEKASRREMEQDMVDALTARTAELRAAAVIPTDTGADGETLGVRQRLVTRDLPGLRDLLSELSLRRHEMDRRVVSRISGNIGELQDALAAESRARKTSEVAFLNACDEMVERLQVEIKEERLAREASEKKVLNALEAAQEQFYDMVLRRYGHTAHSAPSKPGNEFFRDDHGLDRRNGP